MVFALEECMVIEDLVFADVVWLSECGLIELILNVIFAGYCLAKWI